MPGSERSIGRTITGTVNCDGDSTGGWGSRGTLKRSRKETLAADSCSPSVEVRYQWVSEVSVYHSQCLHKLQRKTKPPGRPCYQKNEKAFASPLSV
ncbi:hypothetical protein PSTG_11712 [Puccinia striiformis f. sp. tritici PST-78]|uniref:Uncharacterized protein n=1 Tax=Puccinia striiformis f. sp. tritici PST-78 TaxID=1165861 RepID=A0A0L0V6U7_9BASI|nr:hypothetical protein PSTG_11712 [Puccinia striiformis f. sp. tritici PST-78]